MFLAGHSIGAGTLYPSVGTEEAGVIVQRLSLTFFYNLGVSLSPLKEVRGEVPFAEVWTDIYSAESSLQTLLWTTWMTNAVRSSWQLGKALYDVLHEIRTKADFTKNLTHLQAHEIQSAVKAFEPVMRADLSIADAYYVTSKGGYDTMALITNAVVLFPADLLLKVPEAIPEIQEAGKCLAFELCTAAGIHVLRALELVLKAYFKHVTNGKPLPNNRNLGSYLKALSGVADAKVLGVLTQIKDLHRNTLMHPEEALTKDEAIDLFGIVRSAVGAMLKAMPVPATPGLASMLAAPQAP